MAWIWTPLFATIVLIYLLHHLLPIKNKKKLPPGPLALPLLGHIHHLFGKHPHHNLHHLSQKHGPLMYIRIGSIPAIVVSSPAIAELVLKTHDLAFAGRPQLQTLKQLTYDQRNIIFGQYGPYWRNMRKICTVHLLSHLKIKQFQPMRRAELGLLVSSLRQAAEIRATVDVSERITALNADVACLMVFGKKYPDKDLDKNGFKATIEEAFQVIATPNLGNYFPVMEMMDLQGLNRRAKELGKTFDEFLERIIDEHVGNERVKDTQDFVDTLMGILESGEAGFDFDRRHVKAVLLDMFIGGTDTSSVAILWTLSELIKNPKIMTKLQKELEDVVGMDQIVDESHLDKLEYLDFVVKETLRLHPVAPLISHESLEDCVVSEFHIPKGARLMVNVWSIGRDPNIWQDPENFIPERFIGSNVDLRGNDFQLLPFGSGRRGCPGLHLALIVVRFVVAQLVHCFDWELPNAMLPHDLDMTEHFGVVTSKNQPLMAIPTYRLHN